jgi:hypothetical protein
MVKMSPTFTDAGTTLSAAGNLAGLKGDLELTLTATGTETIVCGAPGGMEPLPKEIELTGVKVVSMGQNTGFADLVSAAPPAPVCAPPEPQPEPPSGAGGVPGGMPGGLAIPMQHDVSFTKALIEVRPVQKDPMMPPLDPVRCISCTFVAPTTDVDAPQTSCLTLFSC